ncbi:hypothetical protein EXM22_06425 [Oceanispirochaeta crateris]|uniref:DUF4432 family protein n=1 Tax=Oceanispirochaeta crateris TaxID=2518645 RepID=A0A5C1QL16_9SPIO|nr:hypothetical protein [Oceanispirochaeta crateris]QEN07640.1 hypothetical protein EXM22_06425 [Oceanispirochaeta crateris]
MKIEKTYDIGDRESVLLENDSFRVLINQEKGMVPELCSRKGKAWINAHWQPWFRNTSSDKWIAEKHEAYWKVPLLFDIAGNFPCCPNFGPGHSWKGSELPPHGFTSSMPWKNQGLRKEKGSVSVQWELSPENQALTFKKVDMIRAHENVHYTSLAVSNRSDSEEELNIGWHNTVGAPFLESGCLINNNSNEFMVPPLGTEFDNTSQLQPGSTSSSLKSMALRAGGTVDMSRVPGVTGYTDFITAKVPSDSPLGWSAVVNTRQKLVYLSWFTGPAKLGKSEIPLFFYNYWMNYGGRPFQPWAAQDGGCDRSFCLGSENSVSYFANGLEESVKNPSLMGHPTHIVLHPGETRVLNYGTAFFSYTGDALDLGISRVEQNEDRLMIYGEGKDSSMSIMAQSRFEELKELSQF